MIPGFASLNEAIGAKKQTVLRFGPNDRDQLLGRFEGDAGKPGELFRVCFTAGNPSAIDPMIAGELPVEFAFNMPSARVFFDAVPVKRGRKWFTPSATFEWPNRLNVIERRNGFREQMPDDVEITTILSLPGGGPTLRTRLWDLDLSGVACICPLHPDLPVPVVSQACGIVLSYRGVDYQLNGVCRNVQKLSSNSMRVGLQLPSEAEFDPATFAGYKQLFEDLHSMRIRRIFRRELRSSSMFGT